MAIPYSIADDEFIIAYFDAIGPIIGPRDLNRSEVSVIKRAKHLKEGGAWLQSLKASFHRAQFSIYRAGKHTQDTDFLVDRLGDLEKQIKAMENAA